MANTPLHVGGLGFQAADSVCAIGFVLNHAGGPTDSLRRSKAGAATFPLPRAPKRKTQVELDHMAYRSGMHWQVRSCKGSVSGGDRLQVRCMRFLLVQDLRADSGRIGNVEISKPARMLGHEQDLF
jgi:hypothetical protein